MIRSMLVILIASFPAFGLSALNAAEDEASAKEAPKIEGRTATEIAESIERIRDAIPAEKLRSFNAAVMDLSYLGREPNAEGYAPTDWMNVRRDIAAGLHEYRGMTADAFLEEHGRYKKLRTLQASQDSISVPGMPAKNRRIPIASRRGPSNEEQLATLEADLKVYEPWLEYWREKVAELGGDPSEVPPSSLRVGQGPERVVRFEQLSSRWAPNPDREADLETAKQGFSLLKKYIDEATEQVAALEERIASSKARETEAIKKRNELTREVRALLEEMTTEIEIDERHTQLVSME